MNEDIFAIRLSEKGVRYLKNIRAISVYLSVVAVLVSAAITIYYVPRMEDFFNSSDVLTAKQRLEVYSFLCYAIVFVILFPLQTYYFYRFSTTLKKTVIAMNDEGFSQSIRWLLMHVIVCTITFTINLLQFLVVLYVDFFLT